MHILRNKWAKLSFFTVKTLSKVTDKFYLSLLADRASNLKITVIRSKLNLTKITRQFNVKG